ncbi:methyltransferase family protein [Maribacter sp. 2307ULW6-5]|uniref:methyltransferase family protein n=1 Tax=Maribacter sp. 2307ULW6-5 TaxID=3386275 RepID=UPI0039BC64AE
MELKLPPVVVFLIFVGLMNVVGNFLPVGYFDFFGRWALAAVLLVAAFVLGLVSLLQFHRSKTSIDPMHPQKITKLVTSGVYQFTRNPMYLALLLVLLAVGLYFGNAFNTLTAAAFVGYMNRFQIIPEERILLEKLGKPYKQYCLMVRRWF